jgi:hypothetical protein
VLVFNLIDGSAGLGFVRRVAATVCAGLGDGVALAERKVLRGKGFGNVVLIGSPQQLPDLTPLGRRAQPPYEVVALSELAGKAAPLTDAEGFASPAAPAGTFR